ncbi:MAG: RadC family protein [Ruminococcus sp.]|jgi:DNA repair protein RadC|nr:RadC family protein [Ruminococcus sp.]
MADKNLHKGHRQRLRDLYLREGIDNFNHHQALELLLFYAIPQRDTNPLAHKLIDEFGSISAVFDAPVTQLKRVGLTDNTIALLKLIPDFSRIYNMDKTDYNSKRVEISKLCEYFRPKFIGRTSEVMYLLLMDKKYKELYCGIISKGSSNTTDVPITKILETAVIYKADYIAIAHNHPGGIALPSREDIETTKLVFNALRLMNKRLIDHVIVSDDDEVSLAQSSVFGRGIFIGDTET